MLQEKNKRVKYALEEVLLLKIHGFGGDDENDQLVGNPKRKV
jgi:hypothetical protein